MATDQTPFQFRVGSRTRFRIENSQLFFFVSISSHLPSPVESLADFLADANAASVPLYHVLWAEADDQNLRVTIAQPSGTKVQSWHVKLDLKAEGSTAALSTAQETEDPEFFKEELLRRVYGKGHTPKRAYVLINPNSGPAQAVRKWKEEVQPLFEAAHLQVDAVVLKRGGEATELVEAADLTKYDTIVALSGDGTPYEIFNGLAKRPDAGKALQTVAVSHIPCGSGNALAYNLYGTASPAQAALDIIKGQIIPMDLMSVSQEGRRFVSFLTQTLGIVAESDLGTENWRWMGSTRFDVGIGLRALQKKCYPCDLAIKLEVEGREAINAHYKKHATGEVSTPLETYPDEGLPPLKYGTIDDELPQDWVVTHEDNVNCFYVGNMQWITRNDHFFRAALPTDGMMDLLITRGDMSPLKIINTLTGVGRDKNFDIESVGYKKISAYRVTPREQETGFISIDGEGVPFKPFQVEVLRGLGRVVAKTSLFMYGGPPGWDV